MAKKKKYCYIYKKLVQGEGDMIGHIAYSVYKSEKVGFIEEYKKANNVSEVPDKKIDEFIEGRETKKSIDNYRSRAKILLAEFVGSSFDEMSEQVINKVTSNLESHIDEKVAPVISDKITSDLTSQIDTKIVPVISPKEEEEEGIWSKIKWGVCSSLIAALLAPLVWLLIGAMVNIHKDNPEQKVYDKINQSIGFSQSATTEQQTANFPDSITQKQAE